MPIFQRPAAVAARQMYRPAARPYMAPRPYTPPVRTVYRPGPAVTRNFYNTTYVNRGWSPAQHQAFERGVHDREFERLMREGRWSREQAEQQAAALAAQQAAAQAAQIAAQAATANAQAQSAAGLQPAGQMPSAPVSPGSPGADLGPTQDQAAADAGGGGGGDGGGGGGDHGGGGGHKHMLLFGGILAGVAVIGYIALKKKKKAKPSGD